MRATLTSIRRAWLLAALFVVAFPIGLGPATSLLGVAPEHHCACGMKRGQCGCLECQKMERTARYVAVRSTCEDDEGMVRVPSLPLACPLGEGALIAKAPFAHVVAEPIAGLRSQISREPSTPPPRA